MRKQTFIQGAIILAVAGLLAKILGFIPRILLPRIMGDVGVGLYQMAFPILGLMITLTTAGIPIAISKLVSEAIAQNEQKKVRHILMISLFIVGGLSIVFTPVLFFAAPLIADVLLTDERAYWPLIAMVPIVPLIGLSAVLRGYFQGKQNMRPSAIYQVVESAVRVGSITFCASLLLPYGVEYAACGAMIGVVLGELAGVLYLIWQFRRVKWSGILAAKKETQLNHFSILQSIMRVAIPVTTSRLVGTVSMVIEPMLVTHSLAIAGFSIAATTAMYGRYAGMAIPILFFPFFVTYSLYVSLVPAISEAMANKNYLNVHHRLNQAIKLSLITGAPAVVLLFVLAIPITSLLYDRSEVGTLLQILAPFSLFLYLQAPLAAVLQGMDRAK
ncbi:MAG: stage V sporulation protein B, partial [Bacilli bacterium]